MGTHFFISSRVGIGKMRILIIAACLLAIGHCRDVTVRLNTLDTLKASRHRDFYNNIIKANLSSTFTDPNKKITVFAPPEGRAFTNDLRYYGLTTAKLNNVTTLQSILKYHVLPDIHEKSEFTNERLFKTLAGPVLRTNHYVLNSRYYVDGSYMDTDVIRTTNGIIYKVQHLLYPITGTVYDAIARDSSLTTLKAAIDAVGLDTFMKDQSPITVFAPNDDAFAQLGNTVQTLLGKPDLLRDILKYHVIYGSLYRGGMHDGNLHTFEEKDQIKLDRDIFGSSIDKARFKDYDRSATNGVIHKITSVLIPDSLKGQI